MRILKFLFSAGLAIAIVAALGALIAREAFLLFGVSAVRAEMMQLKQISVRPTQYTSQCLQKGAVSDQDQGVIESFQLRFISDTEYVTEVVCRQFKLDPIRVDSGELPMFVKKAPGSSGLYWGEASSAVELEVFGRRRSILVEAKDLTYEKPGIVKSGEGPQTACVGYGFECCSEEIAQGSGEQLTGVTDCPRSCYSSCVARPVVLSFSSDPFMDPQTRTAEARSGELVTFSYVSDPVGALEPQATIDFGDGSQEVVADATGSVTHTFNCVEPSCTYQVTISLSDERGRTSAVLPVGHITLRVSPR